MDDEKILSQESSPEEKKKPDLSRRRFLKLAGITVLMAGASGAVLDACTTPENSQSGVAPGATLIPNTGQYPEVPQAPLATPIYTELKFFTPDEAVTVDAVVSRIYPGTPEDPGAHELEVMIYIDRKLAITQNNGFARPTYFKPPFAKPYQGATPPGPDDAKTVYVKATELDRYGFQSSHTPQETYRKGVAGINKYTQGKYGKNFVDLTTDQQDEVLIAMDNAKAEGVDDTNGASLFKAIREDVINGLFSDPAYGGNKDMGAWSQIGYPGAQRAYTPVDLHDEKNVRPPQSLAMMHMFHPGQQANPDVIVPPAGSDQKMPPGQ